MICHPVFLFCHPERSEGSPSMRQYVAKMEIFHFVQRSQRENKTKSTLPRDEPKRRGMSGQRQGDKFVFERSFVLDVPQAKSKGAFVKVFACGFAVE